VLVRTVPRPSGQPPRDRVAGPPAEVRRALGARAGRLLEGGGSPARLWSVQAGSGERLVVKVLHGRDGSVDGHDLRTFELKPRQIRMVHARLPGLSPSYARVVGRWRGPGWAAYAMPHYAGRAVTAPLDRAVPDLAAFQDDLRRVFELLTVEGYAVDRRPAPPDHFRALHVDRLRRRLPLLRRHLDPGLFGDRVMVNGRLCRGLPALLEALGTDDRLGRGLQPGRLSFPVHGDLNLGNLLVGDDGFVVLDPRGTLAPWDPVYDLAKSLFSLTVFEQALARGFTLRSGRQADGTPSWEVALRAGHPGYLTAAAGFIPFLESLSFAAELDRDDPDWRRRLLLTHAVHCLAEAACRLSDRKPRAYGPVAGWAACRLLATGLVLVGLLLLEDLVAVPGDVLPERHFDRLGADLLRATA
jgi:Phosphotransferase enzyme family